MNDVDWSLVEQALDEDDALRTFEVSDVIDLCRVCHTAHDPADHTREWTTGPFSVSFPDRSQEA